MPKTTAKSNTKANVKISEKKVKFLDNTIDHIETARNYLLQYLNQFSTKIIENSMEFDSILVDADEKDEIIYEIIISYYTKNKAFDFDSSSSFQIPNVKNYRKIVLNEEGKLLKITSKID
jgi:hypothetical protein